VERDDGELQHARDSFRACGNEGCPAKIQRQCREWLFDIEARLPSVVFRARTEDGDDLLDARVSVDGKPIPSAMNGRPVALDPGEHVVRWEAPEHRAVQQRVVIRESEKNRFLSAVLPAMQRPRSTVTRRPAAAAAAPPAARIPRAAPERPLPVLFWVGAGLAVAGGATFTWLGLDVRADLADYERCKPGCDRKDVEATASRAIIADAALGVGVVGVGLLTWSLFSRDGAAPGTDSNVGFDFAPGRISARYGARF
jgi:hypothetical protein